MLQEACFEIDQIITNENFAKSDLDYFFIKVKSSSVSCTWNTFITLITNLGRQINNKYTLWKSLKILRYLLAHFSLCGFLVHVQLTLLFSSMICCCVFVVVLESLKKRIFQNLKLNMTKHYKVSWYLKI